MSTQDCFTDPVSGRKVSGGDYLIESIMPAPGWEVRTCDFYKGRPFTKKVQVIGWAVITRDMSGSTDNAFISRYATLLCAKMIDGIPMSFTAEELKENGEVGVETIPPGEKGDADDLVERTKEDLEGFLKLTLEDEEWAREEYKSIQDRCSRGTANEMPSFPRWRKRYADSLREKLGIEEVPANA